MMSPDFESWEDRSDLIDRKDYAGVVKLCEAQAEASPNDLHAQERRGEAYILNEDFGVAIHEMTPLHRQHPDIESFSHIILDALIAPGKTEADFNWSKPPTIIAVDRRRRPGKAAQTTNWAPCRDWPSCTIYVAL